MRYFTSEKFEIIRLLAEQSNLSVSGDITAAWHPQIHFLQFVLDKPELLLRISISIGSSA